jgi:hypothetical protein
MRNSISTKSTNKWPLATLKCFDRSGKENKMKETTLQSDSIQRPKRATLKWIAPIMTGIYCSVITAMPALANSQTIIQGINKGTEQVWRILIAIVAPIGAVALALQVIKIIWGGARAAEEAKSAAIKIIVAIAVVLMAPAIVSAVRSWFTAASWSFS